MPKQPPVNPLLGQNIPPAPGLNNEKPASGENDRTATEEKSKTVSEYNGKMVSGDSAKPLSEHKGKDVSRYNGKTVLGDNDSDVELGEKATIELSLYLRPSQDDKLEDLRRAYKRRVGKKISANEIMRRLIEHASLDDLF
ncbi:hypothetical protein [Dictyobacter arantiisoli]|nr:hypothetical protein [Dictyobacter arantiisoli]